MMAKNLGIKRKLANTNCFELKTYKSVLSEVIYSKIKSTRLQSSSQQNLFHYFSYNRLMDYWHIIG